MFRPRLAITFILLNASRDLWTKITDEAEDLNFSKKEINGLLRMEGRGGGKSNDNGKPLGSTRVVVICPVPDTPELL